MTGDVDVTAVDPELGEGAPDDPAPALARTPGVDEPRRGLGLGLRFFLGGAILLAATLGAAVVVANRRAEQVAQEKIALDLKAVPIVFEGYESAQGAARRGQVRSLAEEPGTKALLAEARGDQATVHDTALEFARGLGAGIVFLFDDRGLLVTRSDRAPGAETGRDFSGVKWVGGPLADQRETSAFILDVSGSRMLQLVASAPVVQGAGRERRLLGVLAAAFPLDRQRAEELAAMTLGDVAFLASFAPRDTTPGLEVTAATGALAAPGFAQGLPGGGDLADSLFKKGQAVGPLAFETQGQKYVATAVPIRSAAGEAIGALLVARSEEKEMAAFHQIRRSLLAVAGAALLLALPASFFLAQGLSKPIRELARCAVEIGRGQLDVVIPTGGSGEVSALASAFGFMVSELKAKAALEAMLAEMQRRPGDITFAGNRPFPEADGASGALGLGSLFAGRYEILSVLGEGGMGTVFRARDRELDDDVALKVLKPALASLAAGPEVLRQEIKLARMITHVNVVRVHDFGETEAARFLTMEYVPGTTLKEVLEKRSGLDLVPALQIAKQICRGLGAVHRAGIVHSDVKPQNVMVMGNGVVKLMDFGVARTGARLEADPTAPVAGTPLYMSPEQARGAELDERSDLYSAGVVMYELFTGRTPFRNPEAMEVMRMHLHDSPPDPRSIRADLPESLSRLILMCLEKAKLRRPASAADLERLLMRVRP
jgi:serine/threonine-protein kinase